MKHCCTPARSGSVTSLAEELTSRSQQQKDAGDMLELPGGCFRMGTDYAQGFPLDGEGHIRPVTLLPFAIDLTPVTNHQFANFIHGTGYKTEAERFG